MTETQTIGMLVHSEPVHAGAGLESAHLNVLEFATDLLLKLYTARQGDKPLHEYSEMFTVWMMCEHVVALRELLASSDPQDYFEHGDVVKLIQDFDSEVAPWLSEDLGMYLTVTPDESAFELRRFSDN